MIRDWLEVERSSLGRRKSYLLGIFLHATINSYWCGCTHFDHLEWESDPALKIDGVKLAFQRHKKESEETPWLERNFLALVVAEAWLEQTTFGLWAQRATNCSTPRCFLFAGAKVRLFFDSANFLRYFFVFSWPYRKKTLLLLKLLAIVQWQYPKQEPNWWT